MKKEKKDPSKKKATTVQPTRSHVKNGHAYFKNTGRYNEVTTVAKGTIPGTSVGD
jgi:hypothetical protein